MEKLREEFNKTSYMGKVIINNCLLPELNNNPEFAGKISNNKKSIDDALKTISEWVKKNGNHTPSHNQIFSAALHYYQEDDPQFIKEIFEEEKLEFGNIEEEFNTPIIKYITGTIIKQTIKEVEKKTPIKEISKKVEDGVKQVSIFDI